MRFCSEATRGLISMMAMATNVYGSPVRVEERSEESNDSEEEENHDAIEVS